MSKLVDIGDIQQLLTAAKKLKKLLQESPEVMAFAEAIKDSRDPVLVLENDRLIRAGEAAEILCCSKNCIGTYCRDGLLTPYYTPGSTKRKFRLSEVWSPAKRM
jgi:hypothetical protein